MNTRAIASSTLWQIGSQAAMAALSIVTVKLVAIGLSQELAGNYNSAYGFLQIFGILADFGLYAVAVREVSRSSDKPKVMGALVILRSIILVLSLLTAIGIVWAVPAWRGTPFPIGVSIAAFVPFFTLLAGIQRTVFQTEYRMHFVFVAEVAQRVLAVAMIAGLVFTGVRDSDDVGVYQYFLAAGGAGALLLFLLSTFYAHRLMRIDLRWNGPLIKELLVKASPYGFAFLCTALYRQLDVTLIAFLRDDFELQNAHYGFALRATEMAYLIPTFLLNSTLPILSKRDAEGEDVRPFVGKIFFAITLVSTTAFLYASLWARPVMQLLTTEAYLSTATSPGSDTALMLLSIPMLLNGIVLFCFYSMLTRNAWQPLVGTLSLGAILSLGLNVFLIRRFGFVGAAWASIVTHVFLAAILLPQAQKILPMRLTEEQAKQWLFYMASVGAFLAIARPFLVNEWVTVAGLLLSFVFVAGIAHVTKITKSLKV